MSRSFFGTDGIRGTVGKSPITPDFVLRLGHAVGQVLRRSEGSPTVLIGKDTRISGYMLESALEAGFASAGVNVLLTGPLPTPGVAYLTRALRLSLGVVISASHNAFEDNGIKFFSSRGEKLSDQWEQEVESMLAGSPEWVDSRSLGRARRVNDAQGRYIEFCKNSCGPDVSLKGIKLVVDAAHGAAYRVAPAVFHELGAEVVSIGCAPDGFNINDGHGATAPGALSAAVIANGADYGIALDGDADRLLIVDSTGRQFNGDELLYVLAMDCKDQGQPVPGVVGTLMTNLSVELALKRAGIPMVRAKVGDRYVLEQLTAHGWQLGGEGSGHLLSLDKHTTGDGIISALQVLQAVQRSGRSLSSLLDGVQLFPQVLINVRLAPGQDWQSNQVLANERSLVEEALSGRGRTLIRASGTEPLLRVMVEADEHALARSCAERLAAAVQPSHAMS